MIRLDSFVKKHFSLLYGLLVLCAAGLYGLLSLDSLVWADEAYTFALVKHSFPELWAITAADVHPPLFYVFLKILGAPFGYSLAACRLISALPCLLVVAAGGWQMKKLFSERTALLFMGLYLLFPYTMTYAAEVRMYSLAEFLVLMNAIYGYRCWRDGRPLDWALFALFGVGAAYTHYFALVSAGMVYGLLLLALLISRRGGLKGWLLASGATILLYLPWLGSFLAQLAFKVSNEYWIEPITLSTIVSWILSVFSAEGWVTSPAFLGLVYAGGFAALLLQRQKAGTWLCLCSLAVPLGTVAVGLAASLLVRPVFVIRYLLPSLPLAVFFLAYVLGNTRKEWLLSALVTVSLAAGLSNGLVAAKNALFPDDAQRITAETVAALPEHSAFLALCDDAVNHHVSQELCYRAPETPVYVPFQPGKDNPYDNRRSIDEFHLADHQSVIYVLNEGQIPPVMGSYTSEYLGTVYVTDTPRELWHLHR